MQAKTIDILSSLLPGEGNTPALVGASNLPQSIQDKSLQRFTDVYRNVAFGWKAATTLANSGMAFPMTLHGRDLWVWKAYLHIADPTRWASDPISHAIALNNRTGKSMADVIRAMLVLPNTSFKEIAHVTSVPVDVISAFESLFYNVKDRIGEKLYLSQVVYPQYKLVELQDDYIKHVSMGDLIIRAGFTSEDIGQVMYAAGMTNNTFLNKLAADPQNEKMLDSHMIANATVLSHLNLTNQSMVGFTQARQLMTAKHAAGGGASSTSGVTMSGTSMLTDWRRNNKLFNQAQIRTMKEYNVVDVSSIEAEEETSKS